VETNIRRCEGYLLQTWPTCSALGDAKLISNYTSGPPTKSQRILGSRHSIAFSVKPKQKAKIIQGPEKRYQPISAAGFFKPTHTGLTL